MSITSVLTFDNKYTPWLLPSLDLSLPVLIQALMDLYMLQEPTGLEFESPIFIFGHVSTPKKESRIGNN